jgi:sugar fermentation stimulation protein A
MEFPDPLIRATLIKRYKRFLSDHELEDGSVVTAHCANTGAMLGLTEPGAETWLSPARNAERKLRYSWEMIRAAPGADGLVGIHTAHPNAIVAEAIAAGQVAALSSYDALKREVRYGKNSRIDILLETPGAPPCYVEVKNVHLVRHSGLAEFPDSVTTRGTKHLRELTNIVRDGGRAVMFYLVQRADCQTFTLSGDIDPDYAAAFAEARQGGVEALCYDCALSLQQISLRHSLPVKEAD